MHSQCCHQQTAAASSSIDPCTTKWTWWPHFTAIKSYCFLSTWLKEPFNGKPKLIVLRDQRFIKTFNYHVHLSSLSSLKQTLSAVTSCGSTQPSLCLVVSPACNLCHKGRTLLVEVGLNMRCPLQLWGTSGWSQMVVLVCKILGSLCFHCATVINVVLVDKVVQGRVTTGFSFKNSLISPSSNIFLIQLIIFSCINYTSYVIYF